MGKKKQLKEKSVGKTEEKGGKKTYSLSANQQDGSSTATDGLHKVTIPRDLESDLLDVIQSANQNRKLDKEVSKRLTVKKLMDMYTSLSNAGFVHRQIESAMENIVLHGGDLIDALDWLCLNTQNDKLPAKFSQTLHDEEVKKNQKRASFDVSLQVPARERVQNNTKTNDKTEQPKKSGKVAPKNWILQYVEQGSDSEPDDEDSDPDPNERYIEVSALLLDAKAEAAEAKKSGDKAKTKEISKKIRDYITELEQLEKDPMFRPEVKLQQTESNDRTCDSQVTQSSSSSGKAQGGADVVADDNDDMGFSLFQQAEEEAPKAKTVTVVPAAKVRNFEYTRQQWTGKSPKQFLIDWVRKHLPKSPPPKYEKKNPRGNIFKCIVKVDRQKEGKLELCPEILCDNVKEAEHLASTLALYHLCKGQSVYQLLPPPYRDVWLEWAEEEKLAAQQDKLEENKPRDQFVSKLMSKLQISEKSGKDRTWASGSTDDTLDSWEDIDDIVGQADIGGVTSTNKPGQLCNVELVKATYRENCQTAIYQDLLSTRQQLPVYQHKQHIIQALSTHNVILVAGQTGSGKSTQVPHFILEECLLESTSRCNIVCTQPRRISAVSLAQRVSQEMGESKLGGPDSLCGYQIRFESKVGPKTRLTYCTTGVLLRKLQVDPVLSNVTHIVVDEVHERSVQSDFLLIILQQVMLSRPDLKVILMSATLDADKFSAYFKRCPVLNIPGRTFPVEVYHVEDIIEQTGYVLDDDSPYCLKQSQLVQEETTSVTVTEKGGNQSQVELFWSKEDMNTIDRSGLSTENYSLKTRNTVTRMNLHRINMDLIVELLLYIENHRDYQQTEGAVLIFLPGLAHITELYELLTTDQRFNNKHKYRVVALHSVLSSADQSQAFTIPPCGTRKIVLATNIAETGITIPDVVFVIDTGKVKENRYIETSQMSALEEVFISKANAKQRQGRAGRVREGTCFRLYTKQQFEDFRPFNVPEILRVPLEELCLHIMKCGYGKPVEFLSGALDPPLPTIVNRAMNLLSSIGACKEGEILTPLGHHLAVLPVHVRIGKMLLYAAILDCLEPMAVIAASMTDKSPFVAPLGKLDAVNAVKQSLAVGCSDQLTMYKAYTGWCEARSKGRPAEMSYCQKNFLKRNTLLEIENIKRDLIKLLASIGFTSKQQKELIDDSDLLKDGVLQISKVQPSNKLTASTIAKVKAILTAGLYPNVGKVSYEAPVDAAANPEQRVCVTETQQGPAHVHPSSVNRLLQANGWIMYHEKVKSTRIYIRDCTLVTPYPLLLFGGEIDVQHTDQLLTIDSSIKFKAYAKTGVIFKEIRKLLDDLLASKLDNPSKDFSDERLVKLIDDLLCSEKLR